MAVLQLKWILAAALATALLSTSCSSNITGLSQYPDVDPTSDVDYIGDAVSISKPMDQAADSTANTLDPRQPAPASN
jgi:hypothetical protein